MSEGRAAATAAHRVGSGAGRLIRAWRNLPHERRLAGYAAIGLFLTLFLPWYQETGFVASTSKTPQPVSQSLNGWAAFSFVEAAVLLVAAGVLTLLFQRAEGRAFHLPGGDGWAIMAAGFWTSVLVIWRIFDKQGTSSHGLFVSSSGIEWGIFVALGVAVFLAYAGSRVRAAHQPEPPLPGENGRRSPSPREDGPGSGAPREDDPGSRRPGEDEPGSRRPGEDEPGSWAPGEDGPGSRFPGDDSPRSPSPAADGPPSPDSPLARRPVGWLSAPPGGRASVPGPDEPRRDRGPDEPRGAPGSDEPRSDRGRGEAPSDRGPEDSRGASRHFRAPKPVRAGEASAESEPPLAVPPSTPAARRRKEPDEQLTIPLERKD